MLFSVEQALVGRDEKRAPLKTPAWEAIADVPPPEMSPAARNVEKRMFSRAKK